jgi:NDP-sugar pyrophosphorylase family protein
MKMDKPFHASQVSPVGWYIASYIQRIDPVEAYEDDKSDHEPWAVWENRILVKASTPDEALLRANEHLSHVGSDYKNTDGVMLRDSVVGLTSLIPIYDALEDGNEIEWIDRTGDSVIEMHERVRDNSTLEAFTIPKNAQINAGEQDAADQSLTAP